MIFDFVWSLSRVLPKRKTEPVPMALVDGTFNAWGKQISAQHEEEHYNNLSSPRLKKLPQEVVHSPSVEGSKLCLGGHWVMIW